MMKTLKERKEELALRERNLREELDLNSEGLKGKAKQVGKIALISGGVALLGFWVYKAFFEDKNPKKTSKKSKKRLKAAKNVSSRLGQMALPYLGKILDSVFQEDKEDQAKENIKKV